MATIIKKCNPLLPVNPIVIGKLGATYGILGWIKVFSFTEKDENIFSYQPWYIQFQISWQIVHLERWKYHNKDFIIKIKSVNDRKAANLLTNSEIVVNASQFPVLEEGDYYWKDLVGCEVITSIGYQFGKVIDMMETGSNDILVVKANLKDSFGIKNRLIPFVIGQVIKHVNLFNKTIEVDWNPSFEL